MFGQMSDPLLLPANGGVVTVSVTAAASWVIEGAVPRTTMDWLPVGVVPPTFVVTVSVELPLKELIEAGVPDELGAVSVQLAKNVAQLVRTLRLTVSALPPSRVVLMVYVVVAPPLDTLRVDGVSAIEKSFGATVPARLDRPQ